jgi:hypothetical protein
MTEEEERQLNIEFLEQQKANYRQMWSSPVVEEAIRTIDRMIKELKGE